MGMEGALHHIMWGGLEARDIFRSDTDREDLVKRLNEIVPKSQTVICAWCLMSNHLLCGAPHKTCLLIKLEA